MIAASLGLAAALHAMTVDDLWALSRVGAPSLSPNGSLVVFPDENHWVLKAQGAKLWYGDVLNWLDRWLKRAS
jgi:hypothetical protein